MLNESVNKYIAIILVYYTKYCSQLSFMFAKNSWRFRQDEKNSWHWNVFLEDIKIYILKVCKKRFLLIKMEWIWFPTYRIKDWLSSSFYLWNNHLSLNVKRPYPSIQSMTSTSWTKAISEKKFLPNVFPLGNESQRGHIYSLIVGLLIKKVITNHFGVI